MSSLQLRIGFDFIWQLSQTNTAGLLASYTKAHIGFSDEDNEQIISLVRGLVEHVSVLKIKGLHSYKLAK